MAGTKEIALKNLEKAWKAPKNTHKFTNLKNAFLEAFDKIGGAEELAKWAEDKKNRKEFYLMIARMLPKSVDVEGRFEHFVADYSAIIGKLIPELAKGTENKKAE